MTSYTVIYSVPGSLRPKAIQFVDEMAEVDAIRFAAKYAGARIRRDSDNAYFDERSGQWLKQTYI